MHSSAARKASLGSSSPRKTLKGLRRAGEEAPHRVPRDRRRRTECVAHHICSRKDPCHRRDRRPRLETAHGGVDATAHDWTPRVRSCRRERLIRVVWVPPRDSRCLLPLSPLRPSRMARRRYARTRNDGEMTDTPCARSPGALLARSTRWPASPSPRGPRLYSGRRPPRTSSRASPTPPWAATTRPSSGGWKRTPWRSAATTRERRRATRGNKATRGRVTGGGSVVLDTTRTKTLAPLGARLLPRSRRARRPRLRPGRFRR